MWFKCNNIHTYIYTPLRVWWLSEEASHLILMWQPSHKVKIYRPLVVCECYETVTQQGVFVSIFDIQTFFFYSLFIFTTHYPRHHYVISESRYNDVVENLNKITAPFKVNERTWRENPWVTSSNHKVLLNVGRWELQGNCGENEVLLWLALLFYVNLVLLLCVSLILFWFSFYFPHIGAHCALFIRMNHVLSPL